MIIKNIRHILYILAVLGWKKISGVLVKSNRFIKNIASSHRSYAPITRFEAEMLRAENNRLRALATIDELTGLNNRRTFFEHVEDHIADLARLKNRIDFFAQMSKRGSDESVIFYIDLYDFSAINNNLGHQAGDRALKIISKVFLQNARRSDFPARIGGDEFAILLPYCNLEKANVLLERLKNSFDHLSMDWNGKKIKLMATIGAAVVDINLSVEDNLNKADKAMYEEKKYQEKVFPKVSGLEELLARNSANEDNAYYLRKEFA